MRRGGLKARLAVTFALGVAAALVVFSGAVVTALWLDARAERAHPRLAQTAGADEVSDLRRVGVALAVAFPMAVLLAAAAGRALAERAVAPLREATSRVRAASASGLELTLPVSGRGDEWDALAVTLNELLRETRSSFERVRRFTADAAHELRNPVTAILGEADLALFRARDPEALRASLTEIRFEAEHVRRLLDGLLMLARADAGTLLDRRGPVDLNDLAREALDRTRTVAARPELRFSLREADGAEVVGDAALLARAIGNLLENAARYATSEVRLEFEAGERIVVRVRDDGPGFPPQLRDRVGERFFRADPAREGEHLGLGLSIVTAIARAHGGELRLESPPSGCALALSLPREADAPG